MRYDGSKAVGAIFLSYFQSLKVSPPDPVFGQVATFRADTRANKVSLLVGYYRNEEGQTPAFESIKEAAKGFFPRVEYLPMGGDDHYLNALMELVFGPQLPNIKDRLSSVQTIGGTGALRTIGDLLKMMGHNSIWISDPTWPNHLGIFTAADLEINPYPYHDGVNYGVSFEAMIAALSKIPEKSPVLLHAVCHNPTGFDLSVEQWIELADLMEKRNLFPIFDFAYQGFGKGVEEDAAAIHLFVERGFEFAVTYTCSKSFALYGERVGALFVIVDKNREALTSQLKRICRTGYSNPPRFGAELVQRVLTSPKLYERWEGELKEMRARMQAMRRLFMDKLKIKDPSGEWDFLLRGHGLFVYSGLSETVCARLVDNYGIYLPNNGRINITAINKNNVDHIVDAIADCSRGA
ncbi:MAG: Tyrosine aminotransferase [Chlamydiae bacterium]|nr:Tyrosine aminotransferase [Chlamydiota bacterium]